MDKKKLSKAEVLQKKEDILRRVWVPRVIRNLKALLEKKHTYCFSEGQFSGSELIEEIRKWSVVGKRYTKSFARAMIKLNSKKPKKPEV